MWVGGGRFILLLVKKTKRKKRNQAPDEGRGEAGAGSGRPVRPPRPAARAGRGGRAWHLGADSPHQVRSDGQHAPSAAAPATSDRGTWPRRRSGEQPGAPAPVKPRGLGEGAGPRLRAPDRPRREPPGATPRCPGGVGAGAARSVGSPGLLSPEARPSPAGPVRPPPPRPPPPPNVRLSPRRARV